MQSLSITSVSVLTLISRMEVNSFPDYKVDTFQAALRDSLILVVIFSVRLATNRSALCAPTILTKFKICPLGLLSHFVTGSKVLSVHARMQVRTFEP